MSARNLAAWLIVFASWALLFACSGCASVEAKWYGCDSEVWRGWDYRAECARIGKEKADGPHKRSGA